ncbi:hypothetical protein ES705_40713 [subsurface metagenome]
MLEAIYYLLSVFSYRKIKRKESTNDQANED